MVSLKRDELVLSPDASVELFEILIVAGAPAMGLMLLHIWRDKNEQSTLDHLRVMWHRVDSCYVHQSDLEWLHKMDLKAANEENLIIPQAIILDQRKLRRYYIYLLFRYCMTVILTSRKRTHASPASSCYHTLKDIPPSWLSQTPLGSYRSAPAHTEQRQAFSHHNQFHTGIDVGELHTQTGLYQHHRDPQQQQLQQQIQICDLEATWNHKQHTAEPFNSPWTLYQRQAAMNPSQQARSMKDESDLDSD